MGQQEGVGGELDCPAWNYYCPGDSKLFERVKATGKTELDGYIGIKVDGNVVAGARNNKNNLAHLDLTTDLDVLSAFIMGHVPRDGRPHTVKLDFRAPDNMRVKVVELPEAVTLEPEEPPAGSGLPSAAPAPLGVAPGQMHPGILPHVMPDGRLAYAVPPDAFVAQTTTVHEALRVASNELAEGRRDLKEMFGMAMATVAESAAKSMEATANALATAAEENRRMAEAYAENAQGHWVDKLVPMLPTMLPFAKGLFDTAMDYADKFGVKDLIQAKLTGTSAQAAALEKVVEGGVDVALMVAEKLTGGEGSEAAKTAADAAADAVSGE